MAHAITSTVPGADPSWHRQLDNPYYKDSHYHLQRFVRGYVDNEIAPNVEQWEKDGAVPEAVGT